MQNYIHFFNYATLSPSFFHCFLFYRYKQLPPNDQNRSEKPTNKQNGTGTCYTDRNSSGRNAPQMAGGIEIPHVTLEATPDPSQESKKSDASTYEGCDASLYILTH